MPLDKLSHDDLARLIRAGYGVEDIAVRYDCDPEPLREVIKIWRRAGILPRVLAFGSAALRHAPVAYSY